MRWRRQRMHVPCKKLAYRKNSSHSSSTTMSCLDDKHHLQHEALIEDETAHSDRQASLNGSICTMTVSPYYEWIQESDEMIRNIPRSKIRLVRYALVLLSVFYMYKILINGIVQCISKLVLNLLQFPSFFPFQ